MPTRRSVLAVSAAALVAPVAIAQQGVSPTDAPTADKGRVNVKNVAKVLIAKDSPALSVTYEYDFPGRSSVHVGGLGTVPARGAFSYIATDKRLLFTDPTNGNVLADVDLKETVIVAARPPLTQIPSEHDFDTAFRSFIWNSASPFKERANTVLGEYFHYLPRISNDVTFLATTFAPIPLQGVANGVLGQIALLFSFPYDVAASQYAFRVQSLVREGRALSDQFRATTNTAILSSGDRFVDKLVGEMKS
jgi:hypothetical protein